MKILFGRLEPSLKKQYENDRYQLTQLGLDVPPQGTVEMLLPFPNYVTQYNQGNIGACTGYSASWMSSINNTFLYNAYWLYKQGQKDDGDPNTTNDNDGGYVWAVMDVLRKLGHRRVENGSTLPANKDDGILSYYWAKSYDDVRTAIVQKRIGVFGIRWYEEFNNPKKIGNDWYIGTSTSWGRVLGGHAICYLGASDSRGAVALINSWGSKYAPPSGIIWLPYKAVNRLLAENGECAVGLDFIPKPPSSSASVSPSSSASPSAPLQETKKITLIDETENKTYKGILKKI